MERLHELRRRRADIATRMAAFVKQDEERPDDESTPQESVDEFEALRVALAELDGRIQRLEAALAADAGAADNGGDGDGNGEAGLTSTGSAHGGLQTRVGSMGTGGFRVSATARRVPAEGKGFQVARYIIGLAWAKWYGTEKAQEHIYNRFNDDAVAKALNIGVVAEGGALIPQDFSADMIELLRSEVVVRRAGPMVLQMPLGNLTIPRLAGGSTAMYQGELDDMSVTEEAFDDLDLVAKKLTALVPVSNDLIRRAPIGVETVVRDDLVAGVARREDIAFIRGDGTNKTPMGWRSLVLPANLIAVPAGGNLDAVVATIAAMKLALVQGMSRMIRPVWISAAPVFEFISTRRDSVGGFYYRDEMSRGTLEGWPFYYTQQIPTNLGASAAFGSELYLVDMADDVIADTLNMQVDASDVAAYYGTDGKVVSTFQRDQSLFRIITEHDHNMRHLQSLAIAIIPADWQFTGLAPAPGAPWSSQPLNPHWAQAPSAWPASATHDAAPTVYDPSVVHSSAFAGTLTSNPGGGPYPLPGTTFAGQSAPGTEGEERGPGSRPAGGGDTPAGGGGHHRGR